MNVVVLPAWYPTPERPGWGIFVRDHVRAAALEHSVVVVADGGPGPSAKRVFVLDDAVDEGIRTLRVSYPESRVPQARYLLGASRAVARLRREGFRPDLIHAHVHRVGVAATILGRLTGLPVVISEHASELARQPITRGAWIHAKLAFRGADLVCPVSESLRANIERHGISARFRVVPNTVDTSLFFPAATPKAGPPRMVLVAQMTEIKGVGYLLDALAGLADSDRDWALDVVGDGPCLPEHVALADRLGISDLVTFHGHKPKAAVADMMRGASFLVLPSLSENLPVVLIEAMASGLPVVATRVGGVPELIDDQRGVLVPPADSEMLRRGIELMLSSYGDFSPEALAAVARERFSYERVGARWTDVYDEAVLMRRKRGRARAR